MEDGILVLGAVEIVPYGLVRVVEQHGKHNRVGGGNDHAGTAGGQTQQNTRCQQEEKNGDERRHVEVPTTVHL